MHTFNFTLVKLVFLRFLLPIENQKSQKFKIFLQENMEKSFEFNFFYDFFLLF